MNARLLLTALTMLSLPSTALAAVNCDTLLANPAPVSPYTEKVLERMENAIHSIGSSSGGSGAADESRLIDAVQWAGATIAATVDSYVQVVEEVRNLTVRSTCEEYDILLLQCGMERVRTEMNDAIADGDFGKAYLLQELHSFINQRLRTLLAGARDPRIQDASWGEKQPFDPPEQVWCCLSEAEEDDEEGGICRQRTPEECGEQGVPFTTLASCTAFGCTPPDPLPEETGMLCPFSSDYFPPSSDGFGCDLSLLRELTGYEGGQRDADILETLMEKLREFRRQARGIGNLEERIDALLNGTVPPPPYTPPANEEEEDPEHRSFEGCPLARCSNDPEQACVTNEDCAAGAFCRRGWKRCEDHDKDFCSTDADCQEGGGGACVLMDPPENVAAWELRGAFSAVRDEAKLLEVFRDLRGREPREFSKELTLPDEQKEGVDYTVYDYVGDKLVRGMVRTEVRGTVQALGRAEADLFARGSDPVYQMAETFQPLRSAGKPLAEIASRQDGLRQLVVRFAWFLRRTCTDRPCSQKLEIIMRLAQAESCFPYTSGQYLNQSCASPLWKQCVDEAKLDGILTPPELDCDE